MLKKPIIHYIVEAILFVIIVLLVSNCKKVEEEEDEPPRVVPVTAFIGQNIVPISGDTFGSNLEVNSGFHKTVAVSWKGAVQPDLKITKAYIQKPDVLDFARFSYIIPINNVSVDHAYCNVRSSNLAFLNSENNKIIGDEANSKAYSSIGLSNSTDWEHCIKPGGTGYVVGTVETLATYPFEAVTIVEVGVTYGSDSVINSGAKVEASSYVLNGDYLDVSIKNNGYDTAYVWPYTSIVLVLSDTGIPMQWTYFNSALKLPIKIDSTINSVDPLPILKGKVSFTGTANKAMFFLTFSTSNIYPF